MDEFLHNMYWRMPWQFKVMIAKIRLELRFPGICRGVCVVWVGKPWRWAWVVYNTWVAQQQPAPSSRSCRQGVELVVVAGKDEVVRCFFSQKRGVIHPSQWNYLAQVIASEAGMRGPVLSLWDSQQPAVAHIPSEALVQNVDAW